MQELTRITMTVQELSQYANLLERLARSEEILENLQNASRPGVSVIDGMPHSTEIKNKMEYIVIEIEDLIERIKYLKREIAKEKKRLNSYFDKIVDERIRMALRLKYVQNLTWKETADMLGDRYTEEGLKKLCYKYIKSDIHNQS